MLQPFSAFSVFCVHTLQRSSYSVRWVAGDELYSELKEPDVITVLRKRFSRCQETQPKAAGALILSGELSKYKSSLN